jgi:hypothetical protein
MCAKSSLMAAGLNSNLHNTKIYDFDNDTGLHIAVSRWSIEDKVKTAEIAASCRRYQRICLWSVEAKFFAGSTWTEGL